MEALWSLGGMAVGVLLTAVVCRQWIGVGIELRSMAADHLERSRAHLDRTAAHLRLVQEVEGRWGIEPQDVRPRSGAISYPGRVVYVDEVRPGESIWAAAERERREKLAKTADLGANTAKPVLEDARGDVFKVDRRGEDDPKREIDVAVAVREDRERIAFERERIEFEAELAAAPVYRTMEEVEAVHGPVVETFYERDADWSKLADGTWPGEGPPEPILGGDLLDKAGHFFDELADGAIADPRQFTEHEASWLAKWLDWHRGRTKG